MCCGDCSPIRCPAVPDTDWSAFTWRWRNEQAEAFPFQQDLELGGPSAETVDFTRQIQTVDRSMIHPGECPCLWLVNVTDVLTNVNNGGVFQSPAIGALQRVGQSWQLTIARWQWGSLSPWWLDESYLAWNFDEVFAGDCSYRWGGYAGWTPYGWNGYGWGYGWGYGAGWGYYGYNYGFRAYYTLSSPKLLSDGSDNVFVASSFETSAAAPSNWNDPRYWPATITLSRIPKTGVLS